LWVIFALLDLDTDPLTRLNPDPIQIQIRIRNPGIKVLIQAIIILIIQVKYTFCPYAGDIFAKNRRQLKITIIYIYVSFLPLLDDVSKEERPEVVSLPFLEGDVP
jgi:hypothetical protein